MSAPDGWRSSVRALLHHVTHTWCSMRLSRSSATSPTPRADAETLHTYSYVPLLYYLTCFDVLLYHQTAICAAGHNAATLHYGHAGAPNDFEVKVWSPPPHIVCTC